VARRTLAASLNGGLAGYDDRPMSARNDQQISAILDALYHGRTEVARDIAAQTTELDVFEAAALGDSARLRTLLTRDAALANAYNVDGFTPLGLAAFFKHSDAVAVLLAAGADPKVASDNAPRFTPLHSAVSTDAGAVDLEMVHALIDSGADVNARNAQGTTALHTAAFTGDVRVAWLLLDHGADPTIASVRGQTPLDIARERGMTEVASALASR